MAVIYAISNLRSELPWLKGLFFSHLNISSLYKHFDELQELVSIFPTFPEIVCLSKVRLKKGLILKFEYTGLELHLQTFAKYYGWRCHVHL